ncbi:MAG: histidinol-phosphatase [Lentimicrobiaceae bacterium]|nr:histidinol-phosphatase [Lentimicrobiaceae bacterium]
MELCNFHTHTTYCDGKAAPEMYVEEAIKQGFTALGFSGHAPYPYENDFAICYEKLDDYCNHIRRLKEENKELIEIYLGLETDYIPGITTDFAAQRRQSNLEYLIGSVHQVQNIDYPELWFIDGPHVKSYDDGLRDIFKNDVKKAVTSFYHQTNEMILTQEFDVLGHFDKIKMHNHNRYFLETEPWYVKLVDETIDLISRKELIVEANTRGVYTKRFNGTYPGVEKLEKLYMKKVPVLISSDAHAPAEISAEFEETRYLLKHIGFRKQMRLTANGWEKTDL